MSAHGPHRRDVTHILCKVSSFLLKSFHFRRLQKRQFFYPYKSLYFERYATMQMLAGAHISSLGYLCYNRQFPGGSLFSSRVFSFSLFPVYKISLLKITIIFHSFCYLTYLRTVQALLVQVNGISEYNVKLYTALIL